MDEDIAIINSNTRKENIKNFFNNNKKILIIFLITIIVLIFGYFFQDELNKRSKIKLANNYNLAVINYEEGNKIKAIDEFKKIINKKDKTYSPLALYFLIDNNLINDQNNINKYFNVLIDETSLEKEIKNLLIYKKALYNSDFLDENELIKILNPITNSESIWKVQAFYLMAEYFYSKKEYRKSKEFYEKILLLEKTNPTLRLEAQTRLKRDLSE